MKKKVLVLLPLYKSNDFILLQYDSIISQNNVCVDVFIYDDSPDKNSQLFLLKNRPNAKFCDSSFHFGNASKSFFHLLLMSKDIMDDYDYIAFADHDDIWSSDKLYFAINSIDSNDSVGFSSSVTAIEYDIESGFLRHKHLTKSKSQRKYDFCFESPGPGCTFVMKKKFVLDILLPRLSDPRINNIYWHDFFIYFVARSNGFNWHISNVSHLIYLQRSNNETGANWNIGSYIKRLKLLYSSWFIEQVILTASISNYNNRLFSCISRNDIKSKMFFLLNFREFRRGFLDSLILLIFLIIRK